MEKFRITFEMTNGESHFYEIKSESVEKIYETINNAPDGWIEVPYQGEKHFIKADKLTRVKLISETDFNQRQKESYERQVNAINSLGF